MYSNKLICDILNYITKNINEKITIDMLEERFFYNRYYIMKLFKKEIGLTIGKYINSVRIYNAIMQIKSENYSFLSIALNNGFYSLEYFSETFKHITGLSPRKYKNYFQRKNNLKFDEINSIVKKISDLYEITKIKTAYISRQKPSINPIKKLSIFR